MELFLEAARLARALLIEGEAGAGKTTIWEAALAARSRRGPERSAPAPLRPRPASRTRPSATSCATAEMPWTSFRRASATRSRWRSCWMTGATTARPAECRPRGARGVQRARRGPPACNRHRRRAVARHRLRGGSGLRRAAPRGRARGVPRGLADRARSTGSTRPRPRAVGRARGAPSVLPLSFGAVQHLIQTRLDFLPPRPALRRLHELSGGNPFFALELARALRRAQSSSSLASRCRWRSMSWWAHACRRCPPRRAARSPPLRPWRSQPSGWWSVAGRRPRCAGRGRAGARHRRARRAGALHPPAAGLRGVRRRRAVAAARPPRPSRRGRDRPRGTRPASRAGRHGPRRGCRQRARGRGVEG